MSETTTNRSHRLRRAVAMGIVWLTVGVPARAEPNWWPHDSKSLATAARHSGKSIVFYFRSKNSVECRQFDTETWPAVSAKAGAKFLWKRCDYEDPEDLRIFNRFNLSTVPMIIVVDPAMGERTRHAVFIEGDHLLGMLNKLSEPELSPDQIFESFGDGTVFSRSELAGKDMKKLAEDHAWAYREKFDDLNGFDDLDRSKYEAYVDAADTIRIEPGQGHNGSNGLLVTPTDGKRYSDQLKPSAALRVDLSSSFKKADLVWAHVEVRLKMRAIELPQDNTPLEVVALTIVPRTAKAPDVSAIKGPLRKSSVVIERRHEQSSWDELTLRTREPVFLPQSTAWLSIWVDGAAMAVAADDLRVRLLIPDRPFPEPPKEQGGFFDAPPPSVRFKQRDQDGDLKVHQEDFPPESRKKIAFIEKKTFEQWFASLDQDKNGYLTPDEFK